MQRWLIPRLAAKSYMLQTHSQQHDFGAKSAFLLKLLGLASKLLVGVLADTASAKWRTSDTEGGLKTPSHTCAHVCCLKQHRLHCPAIDGLGQKVHKPLFHKRCA